MGTWKAFAADVECGFDGHVIVAHQPVYELGRGRYRCQGHAPEHAPVDWAAVDAANHAIEADQATRAASAGIAFKGGAPVLDGFTQATDAATDGLNALLKSQGIKGYRRDPRLPAPRAPKPFAAVAGTLPASTDLD